MIRIDRNNIDVVLNVLYGSERLTKENKDDIKAVLFGDTMTPKGTLKTITAIMGEGVAKYIHIIDKGTGDNSNDIHAINRGDPYRKTILHYRGYYLWGVYGEIVENNISCY